MGEADLKGCHSVQNLGAVQTYTRRYLYITAFEIVEHDALDATTGIDEKQTKSSKGQAKSTDEQIDMEPVKKPSESMLKALYAMAESRGFDRNTVATQTHKKYGVMPPDMSMVQYRAMSSGYDKLPKKDGAA